MPELALRHILQHPAVSTVIPGMRKRDARRSEHRGQRRRSRCRPLMAELEAHRWDRTVDFE